MELEVEVEGIPVTVKVDTGFDGEVIVRKDVFDRIPYEPSYGPRICTASMECYSTYVKLTKVRTLGREVIAEVLNSPVVDKNLIGEGLLKKLQLKIDYKNMRIDDP